MIITKRRPKLKLKDDSREKLQFSIDFSQNYAKCPSTYSVAIATIDVPWDWFVFKMELISI